jgi:hypothetical protein
VVVVVSGGGGGGGGGHCTTHLGGRVGRYVTH